MKRTLLFTAILLVVFIVRTNAQVTFQVGGGVGYEMASGELGADIKSMGDGNYGMDGGLNLHAKARVGLLSFVVAGEIGYTMMSNDGTINSVKYESNLYITSIKLGPEFHFGLPVLPVDPYAGINLQINSFSGDYKIQGVSQMPSGTYDYESATRIGIGINGGAVLNLGGMKLDVNLSYNMLNLIGNENESNPESDKYYLNDDGASLNTIGAKVTLMFGI